MSQKNKDDGLMFVRELIDPNEQILYVQRVHDVEPVIDEIKEISSIGKNGMAPTGNYRRVGSIPMVFVEIILREEGINLLDGSPEAAKRARKFLLENSKFRVDRH